MKITLLVDDQDSNILQKEFGLSLLLETNGDSLLFDTGADSALGNNLQLLKIPSEKVKKIFLSHGHYDHTGGLKNLKPELIYCIKGIEQKRYSYHAHNDLHDISMPQEALQILSNTPVEWIDKPTRITPDLYSTGPIPRDSFEDCGGSFYYDTECTLPDNIPDEHALLSESGVLVSGCCHAGVINTLNCCYKLFPQINIHTVVGGLHLRKASTERLLKTAEFLKQTQVKKLFLLHCTGSGAIEKLSAMLPDIQIITPCPGQSWEC